MPLRKKFTSYVIMAKIKVLLSGEELDMEMKRGTLAWVVVKKLLQMGKSVRLREIDDPLAMEKQINRYVVRNVHRFPILSGVRTHLPDTEGDTVIVYFVPD